MTLQRILFGFCLIILCGEVPPLEAQVVTPVSADSNQTQLSDADTSQQITCTDAPAFSATTAEPVLLRYKLKRDQLWRFTLEMVTRSRIGVGEQFRDFGEKTERFEAKGRVTEVDAEGNISLVMKITRIFMRSLDKITGRAAIEFDSDDLDSDNPNFEAVKAMIGVGIPTSLSPIGEILEQDLHTLLLSFRRLNDAVLTKSLEDSVSKMFEGTFFQLNKHAIAAGQSYEMGTMALPHGMKASLSYTVHSVNDTKTRVILKPTSTAVQSAPSISNNVEAKLVDMDMSGWYLFDVERGFFLEGMLCIHTLMDYTYTVNGQTYRLDYTTTTREQSTLE